MSLRKNRKRTWITATAIVAGIGLALSGCSKGSSSNNADSGKPITLTFWQSMTGTNNQVLTKLVDQFNSENTGKITVKSVFQGKYDDTMAKYKAAIQSNTTPDVAMIYDIGTQFMIDSGTTAPMQTFIDQTKFDSGSLQKNVAGYYRVNGKLWSMPFNTSVPVLYYNKTLFKKAGLDPNKAPATLAEIEHDATVLSKKNGGPAQFGFNAAVYGWFIEQENAANGDFYCTPENGRGSQRATAFNFDNPDTVKFINWWSSMVHDGVAGNTGVNTTDAQNAFDTGTIGITLESTGVLGQFMGAGKSRGFEVGVGAFPRIATNNNAGPAIGGASLWIMKGKNHSTAEQNAAWKFIEFLASPQSQATWHLGTGYFPANTTALTLPTEVAYLKQYPQFKVALDSLDATPLTHATQGCVAGVMPQARQDVQNALSAVLSQNADTQTQLAKVQAEMTTQLQSYNASANNG